MPSSCCCVPGCSNRKGLRFPNDKDLRKQWMVAMRRTDPFNKSNLWEPSPHSIVCYSHFKDTDFHYVNLTADSPRRRQRNKDVVPSVFPWTCNQLEVQDQRYGRLRQRREKLAESTSAIGTEEEYVPHPMDIAGEILIEDSNDDDDVDVVDEEVGSNISTERKTCFTQTEDSPMFGIDKIKDNDDTFLFYTGLASYRDFRYALSSLGDAVHHLNYLYNTVRNVTIENQFLITLMKLRQHKANIELAFFFNISETTVANIWITWINFMYYQWGEVESWPERHLVKFFCPSDFKSKFPSTRVIIDGTEIPVMKPKPPIAQQSTYSTYKNKNTVKVLVGSTPGGLVSYVSPAYGGSTSDRQIVERSELVSACDPGDSIMADKGFNVQDIFAQKDVTINIPTFFSRKNRMSTQTVMKDRKISSKRVHIERIIGLAKTFKILTSPLNSTETRLATEIISVCFMLCRFKKCIVPTTS